MSYTTRAHYVALTRVLERELNNTKLLLQLAHGAERKTEEKCQDLQKTLASTIAERDYYRQQLAGRMDLAKTITPDSEDGLQTGQVPANNSYEMSE